MTKIYRDLDADVPYDADEQRVRAAEAAWQQARKLFRNFRENFVEWVYKELLPKETSDRPATFMEKEIRKSAWDFRYVLDDYELFPAQHSSKSPDWSKFRREREKNIKRYQGKATKALKDIDEYLSTKPEEKLERRAPVEHMEVGGVHVVILNFGRDDDDDENLDAFLRGLRDHVGEIRQAGFAGAVKGLTVTVDFDQQAKDWDTDGKYTPATDTLTMYPLGLAGEGSGHGSFVHECGHRFYFRELPTGARNHWEEVLQSRSVDITQDDVRRFAELVSRKVNPAKLWEMMGDDDRLRAALPDARGPEDEAKFRELCRLPLMPWHVKEFDRAAYERLLSSRVGEPVQIEEITDYGNTNPMEAFAETFRLWVTKGARSVKPWTREFFRTICRSGGAKLASSASVAERYLEGAA